VPVPVHAPAADGGSEAMEVDPLRASAAAGELGSDHHGAGLNLSIVGHACWYHMTASTSTAATPRGAATALGQTSQKRQSGGEGEEDMWEAEVYDEADRGDLPVVHGQLVEDICVNHEDFYLPLRAKYRAALDAEAGAGDEAAGPLDPLASKRAEIVSILADALWPDIVQALRPLVERVVQASRPLGSALYAEAEPVRCGSGAKAHTNLPVDTEEW